jgi:hypothetical protein
LSDLFAQSSAILSPCGLYRYVLTRRWDDRLPDLCWVMLNPSKADAERNDPTINRCMAFARALGRGGIRVVNLFAFRATDPADMRKAADPVGPDNDFHLRNEAHDSRVILAWGAKPWARERIGTVLPLLAGAASIECLRRTKDGYPEHPLFVPGSVRPMPWEPLTDTGESERRGPCRPSA